MRETRGVAALVEDGQEHRTAPELRGKPFALGFDPRRNPGGRPRRPAELVEALRTAEPEAVEALVCLMRSAKSESVRLAAASAILDRLYGRPTQPVSDESAEPLEIRVVYERGVRVSEPQNRLKTS